MWVVAEIVRSGRRHDETHFAVGLVERLTPSKGEGRCPPEERDIAYLAVWARKGVRVFAIINVAKIKNTAAVVTSPKREISGLCSRRFRSGYSKTYSRVLTTATLSNGTD